MRDVKKAGRVRIARNGYLLMSTVFYIAGVLYMFLLDISPLVLCVTAGVILCVYGIFKIIGYLSADLYCLAFQHDLAEGILLVTLGCITLCASHKIIPFLIPGLGILVLLDSLLTIQTAKDAKAFGLPEWRKILIAALAAGVFGVLAILCPRASVATSHIFVGIALIAEGAMTHCVVMYTVKEAKEALTAEEITTED